VAQCVEQASRPVPGTYVACVAVEIVFETHSWTVDNELGNATGWLPGELSERGRRLALELGARRRDDGISAVFCSDLRRAVQTAEIAFGGSGTPVLLDWRLRECDYGDLNGHPAPEVHSAVSGLHDPYPNGESWASAIARVGRFVDDVADRWRDRRVLVIGHIATLWGLAHRISGVPLEEIRAVSDPWREGWEFATDD
jgi:2,3-bisphosphoglycerate-dependent phosphoglycerate mutase